MLHNLFIPEKNFLYISHFHIDVLTEIKTERLQTTRFSYNKYKKSCSHPNSLMDKEKAIIADGLTSVAPPSGLEPETL